jgi:hypothetical protein
MALPGAFGHQLRFDSSAATQGGQNALCPSCSVTKLKIGGWLVAIFLIGVTPMHKFWGISDPMMQQVQMVLFMKNLAMLGGALLISQFGSGPSSLDSRK